MFPTSQATTVPVAEVILRELLPFPRLVVLASSQAASLHVMREAADRARTGERCGCTVIWMDAADLRGREGDSPDRRTLAALESLLVAATQSAWSGVGARPSFLTETHSDTDEEAEGSAGTSDPSAREDDGGCREHGCSDAAAGVPHMTWPLAHLRPTAGLSALRGIGKVGQASLCAVLGLRPPGTLASLRDALLEPSCGGGDAAQVRAILQKARVFRADAIQGVLDLSLPAEAILANLGGGLRGRGAPPLFVLPGWADSDGGAALWRIEALARLVRAVPGASVLTSSGAAPAEVLRVLGGLSGGPDPSPSEFAAPWRVLLAASGEPWAPVGRPNASAAEAITAPPPSQGVPAVQPFPRTAAMPSSASSGLGRAPPSSLPFPGVAGPAAAHVAPPVAVRSRGSGAAAGEAKPTNPWAMPATSMRAAEPPAMPGRPGLYATSASDRESPLVFTTQSSVSSVPRFSGQPAARARPISIDAWVKSTAADGQGAPEPADVCDAFVLWDTENIRVPLESDLGFSPAHLPAALLQELSTAVSVDDRCKLGAVHVLAVHASHARGAALAQLDRWGFSRCDAGIKAGAVDTNIHQAILCLTMAWMREALSVSRRRALVIMSSDIDFAGPLKSVRDIPQLRTVIVHGRNANRRLASFVDAVVSWDGVLGAAQRLAAAPLLAVAVPLPAVDVPLSAMIRVLREEGHAELAARLEAEPAQSWAADLRSSSLDVRVTLHPAVSAPGGEASDWPPSSATDSGRGGPPVAPRPRPGVPTPPRRAPQPTLRPSMLSAGSSIGSAGADVNAAPWNPSSDAAAVADLSERFEGQHLGGGALGASKMPAASQSASWVAKAEKEGKTPEAAARLTGGDVSDDPQLPPQHSTGASFGVPVPLARDFMPFAQPLRRGVSTQLPPRAPPARAQWQGGDADSAYRSFEGSDVGDGTASTEHDWASLVPHPSIRLNNPETNPLYKTQLCKHWMQSGQCRYGPACGFAHGSSDLRPYTGGGPAVEAEGLY